MVPGCVQRRGGRGCEADPGWPDDADHVQADGVQAGGGQGAGRQRAGVRGQVGPPRVERAVRGGQVTGVNDSGKQCTTEKLPARIGGGCRQAGIVAFGGNMKRLIAPACVVVLAAFTLAAVKSGLEAGESPDAFNVKDITGPSKGKSLCYRCQYGAKPVACVFTREITPEVKALVKEIDARVAANKNKEMSAFVVLLTDDADKAS